MSQLTSGQKARVFRLFVNGAIIISDQLHRDIDQCHGPGDAHAIVERQLFKRLITIALRLDLTLAEWESEMDYAGMMELKVSIWNTVSIWPQTMSFGPPAHHALSYGRDAVLFADTTRNNHYRQLKTRLALYKLEKARGIAQETPKLRRAGKLLGLAESELCEIEMEAGLL